MKPLVVLLGVFGLSLMIIRLFTSFWNVDLAGNIAMCCMLCFTAIGHFKFADGMAMMIPDPISGKKTLVYATGFFEVLLGITLLFPAFRYMSGIATIIFLVLVLPMNIYAAFKHIDYEKATFDGKGPAYLLFRIPIQIVYIGWIYYFSIKGGN